MNEFSQNTKKAIRSTSLKAKSTLDNMEEMAIDTVDNLNKTMQQASNKMEEFGSDIQAAASKMQAKISSKANEFQEITQDILDELRNEARNMQSSTPHEQYNDSSQL